MLHRFAKFVAGCTVLLILAGSLVTSHEAGLSVPDWPTSYGWNMFTFPPSMWVANILYEHGHRLVASTVGFLTIVLAIWLWMAEGRRPWLRWLGVAALGAVIAQGLLGGLTVLFFLPPAVSTAHAGLAEIFFCMTVAIALFTSPGWKAGYRDEAANASGTGPSGVDDARVRFLATLTTVLVYTQILVGATMRHTGAGLAIPDFPLMFGHLIPDHWDPRIAVHFAHRTGSAIVATAVVTTAVTLWRRHPDRSELASPALKLLLLVLVQITLGASVVISRLEPWINSVHVVGGALVLTTSLVITLRTWRVRFADDRPDSGELRVAGSSRPSGAAREVRDAASPHADPTPVRGGVRA
jgi:cytochrome c oxidase assembly protein subunit 15